MLLRMLLFIATIVMAGCATPYQPFELFGRGGYQEKRISDDTYQVAYYGNGSTSMETLNSLLLYRSAEITIDRGYDYFDVLSGVARMPLSALSGFRSTEHTIKMFKGQPKPQTSRVSRTYVARKVKEDFGPQIGQKK